MRKWAILTRLLQNHHTRIIKLMNVIDTKDLRFCPMNCIRLLIEIREDGREVRKGKDVEKESCVEGMKFA